MDTYLRLLGYVTPYWRKVVLLVVVVTVFASLSGVSLTLIHPFLRIILQSPGAQVEQVAEDAGGATQGIPLPAQVEAVKERVQAWFEGWMYAGEPADRLLKFCQALLLLFLIKNVFGYLQTYLTTYLEQKVLYRIREDAYSHVLNLPLGFFEREKTGQLISRLTNDINNMRGAVMGVAASFVRNGLMTLIGIVVVLMISWKLSLVTFIVLPLNMLLIAIIGRRLRRRSFRAQENMAEVTSLLDESISGIRVVKAFNMGDYERSRFGKFNYKYMSQYLKMQLWGALSSPTSELLGAFAIVAILFYGGRLVLTGAISPENLVLFVGAIIWVVTPVKTLSRLNSTLQECLACAHRVFEVIDIPPEPIETTKAFRPARFEREIRFEDVGFAYIPGRPVLSHINFRVAPGEVVALVGPSGAGKTTLVDLIPRFYDVTEGRILFDDADSKEFSITSLRDMMGMVTQDIILFNDTVRNNIAYGMDDCPMDKIVAAAQAANAHDFISDMPQQYDTVIGERGMQLSGGQRQRLSIARAILKDPQVLIFDEATSALDTESEILVQEAIDRLLAGRTTFVIAHRLSTIQNADKILVLEGGVMREYGTHEQLMGSDGVYKKLYDLQFGLVS